jgi:hypothetical protein
MRKCIITGKEIPSRIASINTHELAWAAGFFDGEGTSTFGVNSKGSRVLQLAIAQCYSEPLLRFKQAVLNSGHIHSGYNNQGGSGKSYSKLRISTFQDVQMSIILLWPYLSSIKKRQYKEKVNKYLNHGKANVS